MDIQEKLKAKYENTPIYTSAFYADPEDTLKNRATLLSSLKAFTKNQDAATPFALQIMATNAELAIAPLGLLDLQELQDYTAQQRKNDGAIADDETFALPLVVQFEAHTEKASVEKEQVTTVDALFNDFTSAFEKVWAQVKIYLAKNQALLEETVADLITDSQKIAPKFVSQLSAMSAAEREKTIGFKLPDAELERFSGYLADNHEVRAVISSAAAFATNEIIGDSFFGQAMNERILRNTFFWDLDNTFHDIFYYFLRKYAATDAKLAKHLNHIKPGLLSKMRKDAWEKSDELAHDAKTTQKDLDRMFTAVFMPLSEQLAAAIAKFNH
ncbi:hypothetical protein [Loigolactobacillus binensis]|uniref:Uncharacterized protein n=1 Tax=Loigolactobacillus binensis TaxID=2559922 RepID=A0ABW3E9B7_9LACO|nr:hypothetical protein [Loigolactobacillus binensis]